MNPAEPLRSVHTTNFPDILQQLSISLAISTYQAGKLILVRADGNTLNTHFRIFKKPMGLAGDREKLAIGSEVQIWELRNAPAVAQKLDPPGKHDACYLPRRTHITGDIDIHEMAYIKNELWFINTRFSCLCTLDGVSSFTPRWRPPFVSAYALEDRCHLNGLAVVGDRAKYVTALGETDTLEGWRQNKASGGILMDVESNEIICRGLSMPHSPRWYDNRLWVLESGKGNLSTVDPTTGKVTAIATLPGFTRGIDFIGRWAFIGLSQVRETAVFSGIPITESLKERICGVWMVNIDTGEIVAFLRFEDAVQEIFAVQILPGILFPDIVDWDEKLLASSYILPDEALQEVVHPALTISKIKPSPAMNGKSDRPDNKPEEYFQLGCDRYNRGKLEEAITYFQQCLELKPDYIAARYNLGVIYREQEKWQQAEFYLNRVIEAQPDNAEAYNNLGIISHNQKQLDRAVFNYEKAIQLKPNFATAHFNLGMTLLQAGQFYRGWKECEWRWQTDEFTPFACPHPKWDGSDISQKTILIHTEQGSGDAIQFIRYIPFLAQRCRGIILVCIPDLIPLFETVEGISKILPPGDIPLLEFQVYAPLMSLPHLLGTSLTNIPDRTPYLGRKEWENEGKLLSHPVGKMNETSLQLKVGIVWSGSPTHKNDRNRSCQLEDFLPVLQTEGVAFYSLQKGTRSPDLAKLPPEITVLDLSPQLTDYEATAKLILQLDLVISIDTSVAHLTGALGKPIWAVLCYAPDWRWMLDRPDSPWYPTMRLFRQTKPKNWTQVFKNLGRSLSQLVTEIKNS
ncbi:MULTISPECIES: TIGR03032 family protein [Spirulina sp. CCY15215]|uniref:TIGR03032 family protein n=1 Tax=Spirulina sp. CCY15215 TaxID=2767591 RepID=UPI00194ED024|nr:TIGR03032 family protein [Spirulina major]